MDVYLARFAILRHRATTINGITLPPGQRAFQLLNGLRLNQQEQWQVLMPLNGALPADEAQFELVLTQLRRYGHMVEQRGPQQRRYMVTGTDVDEQPQQNGAFGGSMSYPVGPAAQSHGAHWQRRLSHLGH